MSNYEHILAATDFSEDSTRALAEAATLAREHGAKLSVVHVHDPAVLFVPAAPDDSRTFVERIVSAEADARKLLARLCDEELGDEERVTPILLKGPSAATAICSWAGENGADLIVVGSHGRTGLRRILIGSVAERVVRMSPCNVLVTRKVPAGSA